MRSPRPNTAGFSLIEVLVASAILAVLLIMIAQILGATTSTSSESRQRLAADREARQALDRLAFDLGRSLLRPDVWFDFSKRNGNDTLSFFSEVPGLGGGSTIAAVGYRVVPGRGLERASVTIPWDEVSFDPTQVRVFSDSDYRVLAPGVIRLELGFLISGDYSNPSAAEPDSSKVTYAHELPSGPSRDWVDDLRAVVISLAVVDGETYKRFEDSWASAGSALVDGTGNRALDLVVSTAPEALNPVFSDWDRVVRNGTVASNPAAGAAIRLYSRVVQLP